MKVVRDPAIGLAVVRVASVRKVSSVKVTVSPDA